MTILTPHDVWLAQGYAAGAAHKLHDCAERRVDRLDDDGLMAAIADLREALRLVGACRAGGRVMERDIRMASIQMMSASRYMAMAVGQNHDNPGKSHWFDEAVKVLTEAALNAGFTLVPITTPAEDHAAAIAARVAEDGPVPITDAPNYVCDDLVVLR